MKHIMLVSHGLFAAGLKNAIEVIIGPQEEVIVLGLEATMGISQFREQFAELIKDFTQEDEIILFCDLLGGSPFTNASELIREKGLLNHSVIVTGMNMPVVVETIMTKDSKTLDEIRQDIKNDAKDSIELFEIPKEADEDDEL